MAELIKGQESFLLCVVCRNLLEQPVLLSCLHNACTTCLDDISRPVDDETAKQMSSSSSSTCGSSKVAEASSELMQVTCPKCKESRIMDKQRRSKINTHVASRIAAIQQQMQQQSGKHCQVCRDSQQGDVPASHRCTECRLLLCENCTSDHARFLRDHSVAAVSTEPTIAASADSATAADRTGLDVEQPRCATHGQPLLYYCNTCNSLTCGVCLQLKCSRNEHSYVLAEVASTEARQSLMDAIERITSSPGMRVLEERVAINQTLTERLQNARRDHLEQLRRQRQEALRAITAACDAAEQRMIELTQREEDETMERMVRVALNGREEDDGDAEQERPSIAAALPPVYEQCVQSMEETLAKYLDNVRVLKEEVQSMRHLILPLGTQHPPNQQ